MTQTTLETLQVKPWDKPRACIIWLHGLGADGHDFEPVAQELNDKYRLNLKFVLPHAPVRPVTLNGGMPMRAWYDIKGMDINQKQDVAGIRESQYLINQLITDEMAEGFTPEQMFIAGFSQGGAMALQCGLRRAEKLAGVIALSSYLPLADSFPNEYNGHPIPVFMAHGNQDPLVNMQLGLQSKNFMATHGLEPAWHTYPMPHCVCPEEIADLATWLKSLLS